MTNEDRQLKRSIISRIAIITIIMVILGFLVVTSFGWFATNSKLTSTGMSVVVRKMDYDILIKRQQYGTAPSNYDEFDRQGYTLKNPDSADVEENRNYYNIYNYVEILKSSLYRNNNEGLAIIDHYDLSATDTSEAEDGKVAFEMYNEYIDDEGLRYLRPGAYGTVTFYIRPNGSSDLTINFMFECNGYKIAVEKINNEDVFVLSDINENISKLLRGHVMFFTGRTGSDGNYVYSNLLQDEDNDGVFRFEFNTAVSSTYSGTETIEGDTCYKKVLYWEWPITYDEIYDNISETDNSDVSLSTGRFPSSISTYISSHPDYFFADAAPDTNIALLSSTDLHDRYNDADQMIGDGSDFLVVYLTAS